MKVDLNGKVALVTGAGGYIGKSIAEKLAENGAAVIINDINAENGETNAAEIVAQYGGEAVYMSGDVSNSAEMDLMAKRVISRFGKLDILVNNAGVNRRNMVWNYTDEDWDLVNRIDAAGTFRCTRAFLKYMMERKYGKIVNIGSIVGLVALREQCAFAAAKAAVFHYTRAAAIELSPYGINVNGIAPGSMGNVGFYKTGQKERGDSLLAHIPMHRPGDPVDIANAVLFLVSDDASYLTGNILTVDGGWTCGYSIEW